ncbi:MAG: trigger factor family protein [Bacteroidales bacterium]|nr:trigger factor family protein [Bacteroidales bacterium]
MNITKKQIDELNLELTLEIAGEDYAEISRKKTADVKRNADFKGFRKGMVPTSLIQKIYGEQILVESVNQLVSESLDEYVKTNKLNLLGEPMASEKQPEIEWKNGNAFTFVFDAALSPEVKLEVVKEDEIPHYSVTVSAEDKKKMVETLRKIESGNKENKEPKTDEQIEKEAEERLNSQYVQEAEWRLGKDIRDYFVGKAKLSLPEAFLKRWLLAANEGKVTKEDVDKEFDGFAQDFKWQLVRSYLMRKFELKVEQKDLQEAAEAFVSYQYAMYGLGNVPAEMIKEAAGNILSDRKQLDRMIEQVEDRKVIDRIKETVTVKSKKITSTKFRELK